MHYCPDGLACDRLGNAEHTHLFTHEAPAKNPKKSFPNNFGGNNYPNYNSNYTNPNYNSNYSQYNYNNNFNNANSFNPPYQKNANNKQNNKQNKQGLPPQQKQPKQKQGPSDSDQPHAVADQNWQNRPGNAPNYPYQPGLASSDEVQKQGVDGGSFFPGYQQSYPSLQGSTNVNAPNPKAQSSHEPASHDVHVQQPRRQHYQPQFQPFYPPLYSAYTPQYPPYQMPVYPYQVAQYEYDSAYWNAEPVEYGHQSSHGAVHEEDDDDDEDEYLDEEAEDFYEEFLNTLKNQKNAQKNAEKNAAPTATPTAKPNTKQESDLDDDMCREFEKFSLEMTDMNETSGTVYYEKGSQARAQRPDVSQADNVATVMESHSK